MQNLKKLWTSVHTGESYCKNTKQLHLFQFCEPKWICDAAISALSWRIRRHYNIKIFTLYL